MIGFFITLAAVPFLATWDGRSRRTTNGSPGDRSAGNDRDPNHAGTVDVRLTRTVPLRVERGSEADSPNPLRRKSWFAGLLFECVTSWFTRLLSGRPFRRGEVLARAGRRSLDREARDGLRAMDRAVAEVDTEGFFRASRQLVRNQLARRFDLVADAISASDAREVLSEPGLPEVLEVANCIIYSGQTLPQEDLAAWRDRVIADLSRLAD